MNSKSRSSAACGEESPPVEIGLSVDDRPNELYIAFWVISSVGAASPLLLHIIYVSVHATSLSSPLFLVFISTLPHTQTHHYILFLHCFVFSFFSLSAFHSFFTFSPLCHSVPWYLSSLSHLSIFRIFSPSLSFPLYLSPASIIPSFPSFILFISASLCVLPSLPQQLPVFFLSDTLWAFFLSSCLSLWVSLSLPSLWFSLLLSLPLISEPTS